MTTWRIVTQQNMQIWYSKRKYYTVKFNILGILCTMYIGKILQCQSIKLKYTIDLQLIYFTLFLSSIKSQCYTVIRWVHRGITYTIYVTYYVILLSIDRYLHVSSTFEVLIKIVKNHLRNQKWYIFTYYIYKYLFFYDIQPLYLNRKKNFNLWFILKQL